MLQPFKGRCHTCGHDHDAEIQHWRDVLGLKKRVNGMPPSADERYLRRLLAVRSGIPHVYMDDDEAQGQEGGIEIDFMRDSVNDIESKLLAVNVIRFRKTQAQGEG